MAARGARADVHVGENGDGFVHVEWVTVDSVEDANKAYLDVVTLSAGAGRIERVLAEKAVEVRHERLADGAVLADFIVRAAADDAGPETPVVAESARNRFRGIVTRVTRDTVMAQVEMQAGGFRVVSLMSREAADELGLEPGVVAVAAVKATNVVVEVPQR